MDTGPVNDPHLDLNPLEELAAYLGSRFDPGWAATPRERLAEAWRCSDPRTPEAILAFYRGSEGYLYDLAAWHCDRDRIRQTDLLLACGLREGVRTVLDYGCGIGTDGLWFAAAGCRVTFADLENPSLEYLRWRIRRRGWEDRCRVVPLDGKEVRLPGEWDFGLCLDVLEHLAEPDPVLRFLAERCSLLAVNAAPPGPLHPMHLPENAPLAHGGLEARLGELGFVRPAARFPWFYRRPTPLLPGRPLGLGVVTYNRRASLQECLARLETHTRTPYRLVVADDGSTDGTVEWARAAGHLVVTGANRGIAGNKNRALYYLYEHTPCDPILLLEDDTRVWEPGWEEEWITASRRWGQVNWAIVYDPEAARGTPEDPYRTDGFGGQCTGTTRETLRRVGYLDPRFRGYGGEHVEWTHRVARAYAERWAPDPEQAPCLTAHVGVLFEDSFYQGQQVLRNRMLLEQLVAEAGPLYRAPWRSAAEAEALRAEVREAIAVQFRS